MSTVSQPDDNMIPGQTYTFQMNMTGIAWPPSTGDVTTAIVNNAPQFCSNVQVTSPFTTTLYNIQFDYSGDGTDVISDVGASLVQALATLGKSFEMKGAVQDTAASITVSPSNAASKVGDAVSDAINKTVQSVTKTTAQGAQNLLTPIEIAVGIVVLLVVVLIFTAGKAGGVSGGPEGFKIGG
jgi:hypothetical protein